MADVVIFPEQTLAFQFEDSMGVFEVSPSPIVLVDGETYRVVVDSTEHELTCIAADGSLALIYGDVLGEPTDGDFMIVYDPPEFTGTEGGTASVVIIDSTNTANHTFAIYQVAKESATIVLRDRNGNPVEYPGIERIKLNTVDGGVQNFGAYDPDTLTPENLANGVKVGGVVGTITVPDIVENMPIALDFTGGNQSVVAPDGMVVKSAIIQKPENLTPGNIAEGVDIAGIVGTLAAGGGGGKVACGTFTGTGAEMVITHGLGVVPDVVSIACQHPPRVSSNYLQNLTAISEALRTKLGNNSIGQYGSKSYTNSYDKYSVMGHHLTQGYGAIKADENTFTVGNAACPSTYLVTPYNGSVYYWFAIGGLDLE